MKKQFYVLALLVLTFFTANAQYTSPGAGNNYNPDSLVNLSSGAVVLDSPGYFRITQDIFISRTDTLSVLAPAVLKIDSGVLIEIEGVIKVYGDLNDRVLITASDTTKNFKGITIDSSSASVIRYAEISFGGGIRLLDTDMDISNVIFYKNNRAHSTNTINLFRSSPYISQCTFISNIGSAIGGGVNIANAPQIMDCRFYFNNTQNDNRPQINLGASGPNSTLISNCHIEGLYTMAGAISLFGIGEVNAIVENNTIVNNRYGIALMGSNNRTIVRDNIIENNNIQNDPMLGGSGINVFGDTTNLAMISGNYFAGNLWGITIQGNARPNIGQTGINEGNNEFINNGNGGVTYAIYNNTPEFIYAENNKFENFTLLTEVESVVFHQNDSAALGFVDFDPFVGQVNPVGVETDKTQAFTLYPNPASGSIQLKGIDLNVSGVVNVFDLQGVKVMSVTLSERIDLMRLSEGMYVLQILQNGQSYQQKFMIQK